MHLEIPFWNQCNNNCVMCTNPPNFRREKPIDLASIKKYLKWKIGGEEDNIKSIYLTGGEPTMQPNFLTIINYLQKKFPVSRINILSNGRRFFYEDFTKACIALGKVSFIIPVHGPDSKSHDAVTRIKGSFEQTLGGIENILSLRRPDQEIEIRLVATKFTHKNLRKTLDSLLKKFPTIHRIVIIFLEYEGQAVENLKSVRLTYSDFGSDLKELMPYLRKYKNIRLYHLPLCTVSEEFWPFVWRTLGEDEVAYLNKCDKCKVKEFCLGIHKKYLELFGPKEFRPVQTSHALKISDNYHHPIISVEKKS
ncbi:MAG: radical SAM protein [Patescibacteria group bacterium]|nr:radical SAM protein [Patescibacteria group bacterium]